MSRWSRLPVIGEAVYLFYAPWVRAVCGWGGLLPVGVVTQFEMGYQRIRQYLQR